MDYITKSIYGDDWNFYLSEEKDNVIIDEGSEAETDAESKEVWFRKNDLKFTTVIHEVVHVFFSYTYTATASLDGLQTEEISAELFSHQGQKILDISKEIYNELLKLRERK